MNREQHDRSVMKIMDEHFCEQGLFVYQVTECDFYAAASLVQAQEKCANDMGIRLSDAIRDGDIEEKTAPLNLDTNSIAETDENECPTGKRITFRDALKDDIKQGREFPAWVWGSDY